MKFSRIRTTLGILVALLLTGCGSLPQTSSPSSPSSPSSSSSPSDSSDSSDPAVLAAPSAPSAPATPHETTDGKTYQPRTATQAAETADGKTQQPRAATQADDADDQGTRVRVVRIPKPIPPGVSDGASGAVTVAEAPLEPDLWQRLRITFRLANLEQDQRRLHYYEKWYAARPAYFTRLTERARWFLPYVLEQVEKRGMPGEIALLPAIESAFRPDAVSRSRAVGLWQFIAATGRHYGLRQDWWMDARRDVVQSTRAALDYLEFLVGEFNGDWELALASYNAGEGTVRRQMRHNLKHNRPANYLSLTLRRETTNYVPKLLAVRNIIKHPERYGITLKPLPDRPTLAVVDARSQTDLAVAASLIHLDAAQLRYFNQGYKRGVTPPNGPHSVVVPVEYAAAMDAALARIGAENRLRWTRHPVKKGEYLGRIARQYGVSVDSIMRTNQLTSTRIHPQQELRIPLSTDYQQYAAATPEIRQGRKIHKVRRGDSLWRISRRYGVPITALTRWNQISETTLLHPGQSLVVGH